MKKTIHITIKLSTSTHIINTTAIIKCSTIGNFINLRFLSQNNFPLQQLSWPARLTIWILPTSLRKGVSSLQRARKKVPRMSKALRVSAWVRFRKWLRLVFKNLVLRLEKRPSKTYLDWFLLGLDWYPYVPPFRATSTKFFKNLTISFHFILQCGHLEIDMQHKNACIF